MATCPYGIGFTSNGKVVALWCGLWSCERCRKINAKLWAWRAKLHIDNQQQPAYFWTLTLRGDIRTPYQGFTAIKPLWDTLRRDMQKRHGKWSYLACVECHPERDKIPHFHILSLVPSPVIGTHKTQPIKDYAFSLGFGYMAKEKPVDSGLSAYYVTKYASKHDPAIPRNFRRVRASQDWAKLPEFDHDKYMVKARNESLVDFLLRVNDVSGVDPSVLHWRWQNGLDEYQIDQHKTKYS